MFLTFSLRCSLSLSQKGGGTPIRIRGSNFANLATLKCRFIRPPEQCTAAAGSAPAHIQAACEGADISSNVVTTSRSNCLTAADGTAEGMARIAASGVNCTADPRVCANPTDSTALASELCYYIEDYASSDPITDQGGVSPVFAAVSSLSLSLYLCLSSPNNAI